MSDFQKDDRVVAISGKQRNKHGKVIKTTYGFLEKEYTVKFDDNGDSVIPGAFLKYENLEQHELAAEIKKVGKQVDTVASQLPGEMGTELPNHVRLLGKALASNDKSASAYEYDYVINNLKKAGEVGSVTEEWRETIRISLEKMHWAVKRLP
jgi:hypothetical protein